MNKISINVYKENENWVAVAPDRLGGSKSPDPEKAVCEVLNLAFKADEQLEKIGVSHDDLIHDMSLARERKIMKNQFFKLLIGFGFPIGAITIAMIFVTGHLANTIWDRAEPSGFFENDIKELALPAHSSSGSRVDLKSSQWC